MSLPLKWEFPGGKIEGNETPEDCVMREIREELNLEIKIDDRLLAHTHPIDSEKSIQLIPFVCSLVSGAINLREHKEARWVQKEELMLLDWADVDRPIVHQVMQLSL